MPDTLTHSHSLTQGCHEAHRERLLREIMAVDGVSWKEAHTYDALPHTTHSVIYFQVLDVILY